MTDALVRLSAGAALLCCVGVWLAAWWHRRHRPDAPLSRGMRRAVAVAWGIAGAWTVAFFAAYLVASFWPRPTQTAARPSPVVVD